MTVADASETLTKIEVARTYRGIAPDQHQVPYANLGALLANRAITQPDDPYLIFYNDETNPPRREVYTYAGFNAQVNRLANYMQTGLGLRRGDRIANVAHNHADTVLLYFAAWRLGLTVVPVNVSEDDTRVAFILQNGECKVAFVRSAYLERIEALRSEVPTLRTLVPVGEDAAGPSLQRESAGYPDEWAGEAVPIDQECLIVYTSGTTGAPKGVQLTQYNLLADARGVTEWHRFTPDQRLMCVLPIHHVNGIVVTLITPLYFGGSSVLNRAFKTDQFWKRIAAERVQVVSVVPTLLQYLLEAGEDLSQYDLSGFRHIVCGAGPLSVKLAVGFEAFFRQRIIHGYGLSETTCYSCFLPIDLSDSDQRHWLEDYGYPSIGVPIWPNEMAIHDSQGQPLPPGEKGEIVIRGHNVMLGYYNRPDANRETFAHGWFRSGDEGFFQPDEQGRPFFFITGRIKELIIRGGINYSPFEIDEVLMRLPGVRAGLAVGFPNKYYGEEVGAYVVPNEGVTLDPEAVLRHCWDHIPYSKAPKVVVFGTEVPVTSTGKYQRLKLAPLFEAWEETQFRKPKDVRE